MSELEVNNIQVNNTNKHYVGVMFEDRYKSTEENPKFYGKVYTYSTTRDLKEGQVIRIDTIYGNSRVCVIKENISPEELNFDPENIKEI